MSAFEAQPHLRRITDVLLVEDAVETTLGVLFLKAFLAYSGVNPGTGNTISVPQRTIPLFVPSQRLASELGLEQPLTELLFPGETDKMVAVVAPTGARVVECEELMADAVREIRAAGRVNYSGFGKLIVAERRGKRELRFVASGVLRERVRVSRAAR